jgi:hypothetical protein
VIGTKGLIPPADVGFLGGPGSWLAMTKLSPSFMEEIVVPFVCAGMVYWGKDVC